MRKCPQCGAPVQEPQARFCEDCSAPLAAPDENAEHETAPSAAGNAEREAAAQPATASPPAQSATVAAERTSTRPAVDPPASVPDADAGDDPPAAVSDAVVESGADDVTRPDYRATSDGANAPMANAPAADTVALEVNDAHFYMEGLAGVLDFRVVNRGDCVLEQVRLEAVGRRLGHEATHPQAIPAGQTRWFPLQIEPELAGEHLVDITLRCQRDGVDETWTARTLFKVLRRNESVENLTIHIDQSTQMTGEKIGFGQSIRKEVREGWARGLIRDVNDLLRQSFPASWQGVPLVAQVETGGVRLVPELVSRRPWLKAATLLAGPDATHPRVLLLTGPTVTLGRNRSCDIVLRRFPRSEEHDRLTRLIQGRAPHCSIELNADGVVLRDHETTHGTKLDGMRVTRTVALPLQRASEIAIGAALKLRVRPICDDDAEAATCRGRRLCRLGAPDEVWRQSAGLDLRAILIERLDELATRERYLIVYRWVDWPAELGSLSGASQDAPQGTSEHAASAVGARGVSDAAGVAGAAGHIDWRLIRVRGQLWVEACGLAAGLSAAGVALDRGSAFPVTPGLKLSAGNCQTKLDPPHQIGLEPDQGERMNEA